MNLDNRNMKRIMLIVAFGILLFMGLSNFSSITGVIGRILKVLSPIIQGLCIAFVLNIIMNLFENKLLAFMKKNKSKKVRKLCRPLSLTLTFVVGLGAIAIILVIIIPQIVEAVNMIVEKLPGYANEFFVWAEQLLKDNNISVSTIADWEMDWKSMVDKALDFARKSSSAIVGSTISFTSSIVSGFVNVAMGAIIAVYVLLKKERIQSLAEKTVTAYLPEKLGAAIFKVSKLSYDAFFKFIRGQGIEACILGSLCCIGMLILRLPYAGTVGVLVGVTALIPIFGAWIGGGLSAFLILMASPMKALIFLVFLMILQQIENNLIYPRVVGDSIGLPGLLVMIAVLIGSSLTGIAGILVSVPLCSVLYTLYKEGIDKRLPYKAKKAEASSGK